MVLNEAPSERIRQTWYSRLAQERRELSASVEEALVNAPLEEGFWLDDQSQLATVVGTGKSDKVFPPRLSLQSRSLPRASSRVGTGLVNAQGDTPQRTSIWTRFTQRLTSLFAPFRFHSSVAATPDLPALADNSVSIQPAQAEKVIYPSGGTSGPNDSHALSATLCEVGSKSDCRVETGMNVRYGASRSTQQGRKRLAGRTTRIRLEVVPAPSSTSILNEEKPYQESKSISSPPFVDDDEGTTTFRLPRVEKVTKQPVEGHTFADGDRGTTSLRLPAIEKVARRREGPSLASGSGAGRFECGQRDVAISHPSVRASSVVLVTLTANPGPVVVQYVSLQPGIGFTVHLTAPTTVGAPFNYVVLGTS